MQINVSAIREQIGGQLPAEGEVAGLTLEASGGEAVTCSPVVVRGSVTNTGKGYLVRAHLGCTARMTCTRCLSPYSHRLERTVQEMFYPERLRGEHPEGEDVANWFSGDVLDLRDVIREHLQLAVPMKRLCREGCRGLCPVCGRNLNEDSCDCEIPSGDSRWEPLRRLLAGPAGANREE